MNRFVIDASVVAAALFSEEHADHARELLAGKSELHAPDFVAIEIASVIWKRHGRDEIDSVEAMELLADVEVLPLLKTLATDLIQPALEIAMRSRRSVYDSLYIALAVQKNATLITADRRLVNALSTTPLKKSVAWLGDRR